MNRIGFLAALAAAMFASAGFGQGITPDITNISYGGSALETMDVYKSASTAPAPCVIEIHPGGWAGGGKSEFQYYADLFDRIHALGIAIVSINYPLAPNDTYPAQNLSCQRAVQFVRAHAADWNIDPNAVALCGLSAGGYLATWVAVSPDAADPMAIDPVSQSSSRAQALLLLPSPCDLTPQVYAYDSSVGHGVSPVWGFMGVSTQEGYDAIPQATKLAASPRWVAANGGAAAANAQLPFLTLNYGDPALTSSSQLAIPDTDLHGALQGLLMCETLVALGNTDASCYIAPTVHPESGVLDQSQLAADWLWERLAGNGVRNRGFGVPGCYATQFLNATGSAHAGNINFGIREYDAYPNSLGLLLISDLAGAGQVDYFGIGLPLLLNPATPYLIGLDTVAQPDGRANVAIPLPDAPFMHGLTVYAQSVWLWPDPSLLNGCQTSPYQLSASNLLELTIQ
jgi:poly(3-hydroxybutyrate) depolymerase